MKFLVRVEMSANAKPVKQQNMKVFSAAHPMMVGAVADVSTVKTLLVLLIDVFENGTKHLGIFCGPKIMLFKDERIDNLFILDKTMVNLTDTDTYRVKIFVQFEVLFGSSLGFLLFGIPVLRNYTSVDVELGSLSGNGDSGEDGDECSDFMSAAFRKNLGNTGLAVTKDFYHYRRLGRITSPVLDDRDVIIFPEKIDGKFALLHRPKQFVGEKYGTNHPAIWIKFSDTDEMEYGHEWQFWRLQLKEFASRIFKPNAN